MAQIARPQARLGLMILAALAVHGAVIFGVHFQQSPPETSATKALRVALVRAPNLRKPDEEAPEAEADNLTEDNAPAPMPERTVPLLEPLPEVAPTPEPPVAAPQPAPTVDSPPQPSDETQSEQEPEPDRLEAQEQAETTATPKPRIAVQPKPKLRAKDLMRQARQLAQRSVPEQAIDRDKKGQGPSTRYSIREAYVRGWIRKVQDWGTRNFPEEARRENLTGSLTLRVTLRHDGAIAEILLLRSSGHSVLDQAAKDIVTLAAPYAPFPAELREQEGDYVSIRRTWQFLQGNRLKSK